MRKQSSGKAPSRQAAHAAAKLHQFDPDMSDSEIRDQLFIDGSTIPLPSIEPAPMEKGLCLSYPRYEIASYAAGSVSFIIPYDKVMPFITDNAKKAMGLK